MPSDDALLNGGTDLLHLRGLRTLEAHARWTTEIQRDEPAVRRPYVLLCTARVTCDIGCGLDGAWEVDLKVLVDYVSSVSWNRRDAIESYVQVIAVDDMHIGDRCALL